jgi:Beta-ketoacyl synthase, N-terminal domain
LLGVTAVIDDDCVIVSGFPDTLETFTDLFREKLTFHDVSVDAFYHSPIQATTLRHILADISRRKIHFPDFDDIKIPVRSSFTGKIIDNSASGSLLELVLDMLLIHPVNWNLVIHEVLKSTECGHPLRIINVGPGVDLMSSLEKAFLGRKVAFDELPAPVPKATKPTPTMHEPIAIVGMAVNMPGAQTMQDLWRLLENGMNTITEVIKILSTSGPSNEWPVQIPGHRFKVSDYDDPKIAKSGRAMTAHTGNFIAGADEFDHNFFHISPREARSMDPQQRILLQTAYEALENCGYVPNETPSFQQRTFGCYIGAATHDYLQNLRDDIDVYYNTGE